VKNPEQCLRQDSAVLRKSDTDPKPGSNGCADRSNFDDANGRPGTDLGKRCELKAANSRSKFDCLARTSAGIAESAYRRVWMSAVCAGKTLCNISDSDGFNGRAGENSQSAGSSANFPLPQARNEEKAKLFPECIN